MRCGGKFNNSFIGNFQQIVTLGRILKIGQYLMKLCLKYYWFLFFRTRCILRTDRRPPTDRRPTNDLTFGKIQMAISQRGVVRSTSCLVLWWGFRDRRIEWCYFRFRQIQDGGPAAMLENSNGDISAADHQIYSVFGSRMGFSGLADRMALIPV